MKRPLRNRPRLALQLAVLLGAAAALAAGCSGVDNAYEPGDPGVCEIKRLPSARLIEARDAGPAYEEATMNRAFGPLFRYIRDNDIPMTAPVEMRQGKEAVMAFHLAPQCEADKAPATGGPVSSRTLPKRSVAALAVRGAYTPERLRETEAILRAWLAGKKEWAVAGEPYAVYWNSPFMPDFLKKSEVHIPVEPAKR